MKKHIIPFAVASALTIAPLSAGALEYNVVKGNYPELSSWTESDWNDYLDKNHGSSLTDYDTVDELEGDIGEPVDVNSLADGNPDKNLLDLMEKYNMDTNELTSFLDKNENKDNIHFIGDLENALEGDGYQPINEEAGNNQTDESGTNGMDQAKLEETYLVPLGWSLDEFNNYLNENYDMDVNDFDLFEDLEAEVGPLLTEENELELIKEYDLTPEGYSTLLGEYGETPEDYVFLYDLRDSLEYYTSGQPNDAQTQKGAEMPDTATNSLAYVLLGLGLVVLGGITLKTRKSFGGK